MTSVRPRLAHCSDLRVKQRQSKQDYRSQALGRRSSVSDYLKSRKRANRNFIQQQGYKAKLRSIPPKAFGYKHQIKQFPYQVNFELIRKLNNKVKIKPKWIETLLKSELSSLKHLSADQSIKSSEVAKVLKQATNIEILELIDGFKVNAAIINTLPYLNKLKELNISYASIMQPKRFIGLLKRFGTKFPIHSIKAKGCVGINDAIIQALSNLKDLTCLDIRQCEKVTDAGLDYLAKISKLDRITFGGGQETSEGSLKVDEQKNYRYYRYTQNSDSESDLEDL